MKNRRRQTDEGWIQSHWRAAMGWSYLVICLFDFMIAPIIMVWFSAYTKTPIVPWVPLTIQGGGLYHLAMGAVVGITSYSRTREKLNMQGPSSVSDPAAESDPKTVK